MNTELFMQNLQDGLLIALIGMGVVLFFLTLMMGVMKITDFVMIKLNKYFPEEIKEEPKRNISTSKQDEEIAIAITAAIKKSSLLRGGQ